MMETSDVFSYITSEENNYRTARVPLTNSKNWNMYEHIQRCTNVANGWFHRGANDGVRPYNDIVTPVVNVAFRTEGFDVKDIVPYVDDSVNYYKSFLVKKYHPKWARKNQLDTFIDEVVETSIIYDLVLVKDINNTRPEVVDLRTLAFCDQTDVMAGPICITHDYSPAELYSYVKKGWDKAAVETAIAQASVDKEVTLANDQTVKTPSKMVKVYELRGNLPARWNDSSAEMYEYKDQAFFVAFYTDDKGQRQGIQFYAGKDKPLNKVFKALKIDQVRSKGRACGRSIVETLFEPQVWNNYAGIKIKKLLDSAIDVLISDSDELGNQKLSDLPENTVLKVEKGSQTTRLDGTLQNLAQFTNYQQQQENQARIIGSASEGALGVNPVSGTPFALENKIIQEGQGIHDYRQGKIATFFADVLYPDLILKYLVKDMNGGKKFSEELSLEELQEIVDAVVTNQVEDDIKEAILNMKPITEADRQFIFDTKKDAFMEAGARRFLEIIEGELEEIPMDVFMNIKGKQRRMVENADKITNIIREVIRNPQAIAQIPGIGRAFNQLLEESGMTPIHFGGLTKLPEQPQEPQLEAPVAASTV